TSRSSSASSSPTRSAPRPPRSPATTSRTPRTSTTSTATSRTSSPRYGIRSSLHYHSVRCAERTARGCAPSAGRVWRTTRGTHTNLSALGGRRLRACSTPRTCPTRRKRASRGCSEAQDVAQQHPCASFAVEDDRREPHHLPAVQGRQVVARGVPDVRYLQGPPVRRGAAHRARRLRRVAPAAPASGLLEKLAVHLDPERLVLALTHRSFARENGGEDAEARLTEHAACCACPRLHRHPSFSCLRSRTGRSRTRTAASPRTSVSSSSVTPSWASSSRRPSTAATPTCPRASSPRC